MSQYQIECRFVEWCRAGADPSRAGTVGDWSLDLQGEKLVLSPVQQRWLFFDSAHGEWVDTGLEPGQAILVSLEGVTGGRRALEPGEEALPLAQRVELVASRVIGVIDGELMGPMEPARLEARSARRPGAALLVWSTRHSDWRGGSLVLGAVVAPQLPPPLYCNGCGGRLEDGGRFCGACGRPIG